MPIPPAARLYFIYQTGCPACASAEPPLARFSRKNPHLMILRRNAQKSPEVAGFEPNGTPAYLLMVEGTPVWRHEGMLDEVELQRVWDQAKSGEAPEPIEDEGDSEDNIPRKRKGKELDTEEEE